MEDDEAAYYEELIADQKQQVADAKEESENLAEELKETQEAKDPAEPEAKGAESNPDTPEDPSTAKESGKSKIFLVVILLAALGGCGFWLVKKMKKNKPAKKEVNTRDVDDDAGEEIEIPVDTDEDERG